MTGKKRALGSDLKKVDRHVIQPDEYEEIPELTDEMAERADLYQGRKLIRRGRPKSDDPKQLITLLGKKSFLLVSDIETSFLMFNNFIKCLQFFTALMSF